MFYMTTLSWLQIIIILVFIVQIQSFRGLRFTTMTFLHPKSTASSYKESIIQLMKHASTTAASSVIGSTLLSRNAHADFSSMDTSGVKSSSGLILDGVLGKDAYCQLSEDLTICRILNGLWQVSGIHGYTPDKFLSVAEMAKYVDNGFTTFDVADIYGPAEDYVGSFRKGSIASSSSQEAQFLTKWVPRPQQITKQIVTDAINLSLQRMKTDNLDLLQFHWWDYSNKNYYDAINHLMALKEEGKIRNLGLTNFDTKHLQDLIEEGAPIISNQVSFSILDTRPLNRMIPYCKEQKSIKLLTYGTLLGGFISSKWLNQREPDERSLPNVSLRKYLPWIQLWGGWDLFQDLLVVLNTIANKYQVSISNVAVRWVLDQEAVGGVILGSRLGFKEHIRDNKQIFSFSLDETDRQAISDIQSKSKSLFKVFGDCGSEYRRRT